MRANYDQKVDSLYSQFKQANPQGNFDQFRVTPEAMAARKAYNDQMYAFAAQKGIDMKKAASTGASLNAGETPKQETSKFVYSDPDKEKRYQLYVQQQSGKK